MQKVTMNYTTYLFDFDYTLADSSRGIVICYRNVLTSHGYTEVTDEAIKRTIGKTLEESFSILTGVTDEELLAGFRREYVQEANVHMTVNTRFFPETRTVLKELKERGARIGIISTKYRFRIHELLDQHFADNFMDIIVGGEDVQAAKPSPEGLLHAINRLNADKRQVLYIGDSTVDGVSGYSRLVTLMYQAYCVAGPDMKNLISPTPLNCVRNAFTLALNDSGEAFRHTRKSVLPDCFHSVIPSVDIKYAQGLCS